MAQFFQTNNNIAIVGAGPSGIYCAISILAELEKLNYNDFSITIFDNKSPLTTILPTGNKRCNITNAICDIKEFAKNYPRGEKFLYSIFSRYFTYETLEFFKSIGVETYIQEDGRIFPVSNSSYCVREKLLKKLNSYKNYRIVNKKINSKDDLLNFDKIVLAAGSRGVEGLIKSFNHSIIPYKNALCALVVDNFCYPRGVSVKSLQGDFIFTDNGISGPLAFKISSLRAFSGFPYTIEIDLFEYQKLKQEIEDNPKKSIGNIVSKLIPKSLAQVLVKDYAKKASEVSKKDLMSYSKLKLRIISQKPDGEIVRAGGVNLDEVDKNIKSKIYPNLWFCGEILNIDGFCGGFNLQNCWSGSWVVAKDIVGSII